MPRLEIIKNNIRWIDVEKPSVSEMEELRREFNLHPLDIEDCLTRTERSKIDVYDQHLFMVLLFPAYFKKTKEIQSSEIHFFITNSVLITVHNGDAGTLINYFKNVENSKDEIPECFSRSSEFLLYDVIKNLQTDTYSMLDHISSDINSIEKQIFAGQEKKMVSEILLTRRNITDIRKIMQAHKKILEKLIANLKASPLFPLKQKDIYFNDLVDHTKEIWEVLGAFKESIEAIQATTESIISHKLNEVMKLLTLISVTLMPVSVIVNIWGMNMDVPLGKNKFGFIFVIGLCVAVIILLVFFFRKKKWY